MPLNEGFLQYVQEYLQEQKESKKQLETYKER